MATAPSRPATRPFQELVLDVLAYLELERGLSRNTLEAYRSDLAQFGQFLAGCGLGALQASERDLREDPLFFGAALAAGSALAGML